MATVNQLIKERPTYFLLVMGDEGCEIRYTHQTRDIPIELGDYCRLVRLPIDTARGGAKWYKQVRTAMADIAKINEAAIVRRVYVEEWDRFLSFGNQ